MFAILDNLFISSAETARIERKLTDARITHIVSIGCDTKDQFQHIEYLSFPKILDTPETNILSITEQTNNFIQSSIDIHDGRVLVHCVYGQSRSATVIINYLLHSGMALDVAMTLMKFKNPSVCINPGFLAQLYFISHAQTDSLEVKFFQINDQALKQNTSEVGESSIGTKRTLKECVDTIDPLSQSHDSMESTVICRKCRSVLAPCSEVLPQSTDPTTFIREHEDGFWRGYKPNRAKSLPPAVNLPEKGLIVVYPQRWMVEQVQRHEDACGTGDKFTVRPAADPAHPSQLALDKKTCTLLCSTCDCPVGYWRAKSLNLMGIYNLCELFALQTDFVRVKKCRPNLL